MGAMARNVMKGFVLTMALAILLVQATMQLDNPSFSYISPNHPIPPLSLFFHISLQLSPSLHIKMLNFKVIIPMDRQKYIYSQEKTKS
jgi:hypothetical protein